MNEKELRQLAWFGFKVNMITAKYVGFFLLFIMPLILVNESRLDLITKKQMLLFSLFSMVGGLFLILLNRVFFPKKKINVKKDSSKSNVVDSEKFYKDFVWSIFKLRFYSSRVIGILIMVIGPIIVLLNYFFGKFELLESIIGAMGIILLGFFVWFFGWIVTPDKKNK